MRGVYKWYVDSLVCGRVDRGRRAGNPSYKVSTRGSVDRGWWVGSPPTRFLHASESVASAGHGLDHCRAFAQLFAERPYLGVHDVASPCIVVPPDILKQ